MRSTTCAHVSYVIARCLGWKIHSTDTRFRSCGGVTMCNSSNFSATYIVFYRCVVCWRGFPTPHHHRHHYITSHQKQTWSPPVLVGFHSIELLNLWTSPQFMTMSMANWALDRKRGELFSRVICVSCCTIIG